MKDGVLIAEGVENSCAVLGQISSFCLVDDT